MSTQPSRGDGVEGRPRGADTSILRGVGGDTAVPFDLPPEQAMALAQITAQGIPDAQLAHRLGMTPAEAARVRGTLLRRRLVQRTPPGRLRATSGLVLTDRGLHGLRWLEQLQNSLPPTLFDPGEPLPAGPFKLVDGVSPPEKPTVLPTGFWARVRRQLLAGERSGSTQSYDPARDETFQRGLTNVILGTGFFGTAVLVGVLQQSERAALAALGVGCLLAVFFFLRAGAVMFRRARARAWLARRLRRLAGDRRSSMPRRRPPRGRALE
ncbi:MAG: hypothetical protein WBZ07_07205 [Candidatus Dormiibacterota bacterium]